MALLVANQLGIAIPDGAPNKLITAAATLTCLTGSLLVATSLLRLGHVADFISLSVPTDLKAGIALSFFVGLEGPDVEIVGKIAQALPSLTMPTLELALQMAPAAIGIALMSFSETIAAGRAFAGQENPLSPQPGIAGHRWRKPCRSLHVGHVGGRWTVANRRRPGRRRALAGGVPGHGCGFGSDDAGARTPALDAPDPPKAIAR